MVKMLESNGSNSSPAFAKASASRLDGVSLDPTPMKKVIILLALFISFNLYAEKYDDFIINCSNKLKNEKVFVLESSSNCFNKNHEGCLYNTGIDGFTIKYSAINNIKTRLEGEINKFGNNVDIIIKEQKGDEIYIDELCPNIVFELQNRKSKKIIKETEDDENYVEQIEKWVINSKGKEGLFLYGGDNFSIVFFYNIYSGEIFCSDIKDCKISTIILKVKKTKTITIK